MTEHLFKPSRLGTMLVPNRVFMAPLTRNRAHDDGTPWAEAATYYAQRASAGLIISEATQMTPLGKGYIRTPGIHEDGHVEAWRAITDAVHAAGGRIYCQLWHVGRIRHTSIEPEGAEPVAPSVLAAEAMTYGKDGFVETSKPRAMSRDEIGQLIEEFAAAANRALDAGFDGVEVHSANGYLLDQFLHSSSNERTDDYGGSIENRCRLTLEVARRVVREIGSNRVGIRLSPLGQANDVHDDDRANLFSHLVRELDTLELAYLHMVEQFPGSQSDGEERAVLEAARKEWNGFYIANGGYDRAAGAKALADGWAHAVAYGRPFLANPDLPTRFLNDVELNEPDQDTFYGGDEKGYTDYPFATLGR